LAVRPGLLPGFLQIRPSSDGPEIVLPDGTVIPLTASPRSALGASGSYRWISFAGFSRSAHPFWDQVPHRAREGGGHPL
jgi:hypothetical protein